MADTTAPPPPPTPAPPPPPAPAPLSYRERLAQFKILEEKRLELIEVPWSQAHAGTTLTEMLP